MHDGVKGGQPKKKRLSGSAERVTRVIFFIISLLDVNPLVGLSLPQIILFAVYGKKGDCSTALIQCVFVGAYCKSRYRPGSALLNFGD